MAKNDEAIEKYQHLYVNQLRARTKLELDEREKHIADPQTFIFPNVEEAKGFIQVITHQTMHAGLKLDEGKENVYVKVPLRIVKALQDSLGIQREDTGLTTKAMADFKANKPKKTSSLRRFAEGDEERILKGRERHRLDDRGDEGFSRY